MELNFWAAAVAGLVVGIAMTTMMTVARKQGMTEMDMALVEGAFFTDDPQKAKIVGLVVHLIVMSALFFASIYALLFTAFDIADGNAWWWGAIFGAVHGAVAGVLMAMMPIVHPRVGGAGVTPAATASSPGIELRSPGLFAHHYGAATPIGLMLGHVV
jgi:uncharacterized membrane protein HdeD (DUF308 family)